MTSGPRVRRSLIVIVCLLLPIAAHAVWDQIEATRLSRAVQAIRDRGEPVNTFALQRPLDSDEQTEASRLYLAAALVVVPKGKATTDSAKPALMLLDAATPLDFARFDRPSYSYLVSDLLDLARLNALRTDALSAGGEARGAASSLLASVRLRRTFPASLSPFATAPSTLGSLGLLLGRVQPEDSALLALQRAYEDIAKSDGLAEALLERRAMMLESVWPHSVARTSWVQRVRPTLGGRTRDDSLMFTVLRAWYTHRIIDDLGRYDEDITRMRLPWPKKLDAVKAQPSPRRIAVVNVAAAGKKLAGNRVAVAILAAERYRRAHDGAVPASLDALVPAYLAAVPIDPFSGAPLKLRQDKDGYTIYSVGDAAGEVGIHVPLHPRQ